MAKKRKELTGARLCAKTLRKKLPSSRKWLLLTYVLAAGCAVAAHCFPSARTELLMISAGLIGLCIPHPASKWRNGH